MVRASRPEEAVPTMQEMSVYGVSFDMVGKQPIVLLKTVSDNRFLPIWIGHAEAAAILLKLQGNEPPRPMTHDLMSDLIGRLNADVLRIVVTEMRESTFYAAITLRHDLQEVEIDARPSDAIALAVRVDAPIFADDGLLEENSVAFDQGMEDTEEMVERFKEFLEDVAPDDFAP